MSSSIKNENPTTHTTEQYNSIIIECEKVPRIAKITAYKGQSDPSIINEWISKIESAMRTRFVDSRYWASAAFDLALFDGPAEKWAKDGLNVVRANNGPIAPLIEWKTFCDAMRVFFVPEAVERALEAKVYRMQKSDTGSVIQYVADLRNCLYLLKPEVRRKINVKQIFFHGLDSEMRDKLEVFYDNLSSDDLMQRALRMCHEEGRWKFRHFFDPNQTEMTLVDPLAIKAVQASPEPTVGVDNINYNRNNSKNRNNKGSDNGKKNNNQRNAAGFPANIVCYTCRGKGHTSRADVGSINKALSVHPPELVPTPVPDPDPDPDPEGFIDPCNRFSCLPLDEAIDDDTYEGHNMCCNPIMMDVPRPGEEAPLSLDAGEGDHTRQTLNNNSVQIARSSDVDAVWRRVANTGGECTKGPNSVPPMKNCSLNFLVDVEEVTDKNLNTKPQLVGKGPPTPKFSVKVSARPIVPPVTPPISEMEISKIDINAVTPDDGPEIGKKIVVPTCIKLQSRDWKPRFNALIDSGAASYFVSHEAIQRNHLEHLTVPCPPIKLSSAFSNSQTCKRKVQLTFHIGPIEATKSFFVVHGLSHDMILGTPFTAEFADFVDLKSFSVAGVGSVADDPLFVSAIEFERLAKSKENAIGICVLKFDEPVKEPASLEVLPFDASEYKDVLTNDPPTGLPPERDVTHPIDVVPGSTPPYRSYYRLSKAESDYLTEELSKMANTGMIRPSSSPYSAPVLFVKKKDGSLRLCVDYRMLNNITIKNRYPLPFIEEMLNKVEDARVFSKLDLRSGYHQIRIRPQDIEKTAFSTSTGHWEFLVMPFGLTNAPATFQNFMNDIFRPYIDKFVNVYLDDILVFSKTKEEHVQHLKKVLDVLKENKLVANLKKCEFFKTELDFLGYKLDAKGIHITDEKVRAVKEFPIPKTVKECQRFLGMTNYYRKFVPNFSGIAAPLHDFTSEKTKWTETQTQAFETLKEKLIDAPILISPNSKHTYVLTTDASNKNIGATLEQYEGSRLLGVIAYFSRKLKPTEVNYAVRDLEFLAVVDALQHFRPLLLGRHFILRTDHFSLTQLQSQTKPPHGRIARWFDALADYDFTTQYIKGKQNVVADALSRQPSVNAIDTNDATNEEEELMSTPSDDIIRRVRDKLDSDDYFANVIRILNDENDPAHRTISSKYHLDDGLLYFKITPVLDSNQYRLCIPDCSLRADLVAMAHTNGHYGPYRTFLRLAHFYYWPVMFPEVKRIVDHCPDCAYTQPNKKTHGYLQPLQIPQQRWDSISLDFVSGLPEVDGYDMILVVVDRLSKRARFLPTTKTLTGKDCAYLLHREIFKIHGFPLDIVSDRDVRFQELFWKTMHLINGTKNLQSTSFHPETDGQTERVNRVLRALMSSHAVQYGFNWPFHLATLEFSYNSTFQATIRASPFMADLGRVPRNPSFITPPMSFTGKIEAEDFAIITQAILARTRDFIAEAQDKQSLYANKTRTALVLKENDEVLVRYAYSLAPNSNKYIDSVNLFTGPYRVVKKIDDNVYEIDLPEYDRSRRNINVSRLKKFEPSEAFPRSPPLNLEAVKARITEISGIVGETDDAYLLQFSNCRPGHIVAVNKQVLNLLSPAEQERIKRNANAMTRNLMTHPDLAKEQFTHNQHLWRNQALSFFNQEQINHMNRDDS